MKTKAKFRKVMSAILVLALLITYTPTSLFSSAYAAAGAADGQVEYEGGTNSATGRYEIDVSKTIKAVEGKENYFDITLKTTTKRHEVDLSTDVVIVMDISNTMNSDASGVYDVSDINKKLYYAKAATNTFISKFATNDNLDNNRKVGIVTFNRDAQVVVPLTETNDYYDFDNPNSNDDIYAKVNAITAPTANAVKWTNIQAGLQLAANMLEDSTAVYKYVILMTDGFPTTYQVDPTDTSKTYLQGYNTIMSGNYDASRLSEEGYFANTRTKELNTGGVSYSDRATKKAQATAEDMKDSGISIFSVGIALASQNLSTMWSYIIDTTGMGENDTYVIGGTTDTYKAWLENSIAGGALLIGSANKYSDAYNQAQLESDFEKIMDDIEHAPPVTMRTFYTLDPMGPYAEFVGFYDKDDKLVANVDKTTKDVIDAELNGQSTENAENTAVYNKAYGTVTAEANKERIYWDMLNSGYTTTEDGHLVFELTYRVRLENENEAYKWVTETETNGTTTLNYTQQYADSGEDVPDGTGIINYPIPKVEGYCGDLTFTKVDENDQPLKDAGFTLSHNGEECSVCNGDAAIVDMTATSDAAGHVTFSNIPSGHEYTLNETTIPEGYQPINPYKIIVSYGKTYVGSISDANEITGYDDLKISNTKMIPVALHLQIGKTMDGEIPEAGAFTFLLQSTKNVAEMENYTEHKSNDEYGMAIFDKMIFDKAGEYEFTITEVAGNDSSIVYDGTTRTVNIVVSKTEDGTAYQADISIDGGETVRHVGKEGTVDIVNVGSFANTTRTDGKAQIVAAKEFKDADGNIQTLEGGEFTFQLKDADGNVIQTKTNAADGSVTFDEITYSAAGTYNYTISEVAGTGNAIVYDKTVYSATVTVTAPDKLTDSSAFTTEVKYAKGSDLVNQATFINKERKVPQITLTGVKTLNGKTPAENDFTFKIVEIDRATGEEIGTVQTVKNDADGYIRFDFEEIVASLIAEHESNNKARVSDYHTFKIYEVAGDSVVNGEIMDYDETYYELTLAADAPVGNESYTLSAYLYKVDDGFSTQLAYIDQSNNIEIGIDKVAFKNTSKVQLDLSATKSFLKQDGTPLTMNDGQFQFVLNDENGDEIETVGNKADGSIDFSTIEFDSSDAGEYRYVVYENTKDKDSSIYYDEAVFAVDFEVKIDENGHLTITEPEYEKNGESADSIAFVNKEADPTHLQLIATKTVNDQEPNANQNFSFKFETVTVPDGVSIDKDALPWSETVQNVGGKAAFTEIEFEQGMEGTYVFEVSEVIPEGATEANRYTYEGMTYDPTVHTIEVVVTSEQGDVKTVVTIDGEKTDATSTQFHVGFENSYTAEPVEVALGASKTLNGRDLISGEFEFELSGDLINGVVTGTNDANGNVTFDSIEFDKVGTYNYTVKEVKGSLGGVTYDEKVYNVVVNVTDNHKGQLEAAITVDGKALASGQSVNDAVKFVNTYNAAPTSTRFTGKKTLSGRNVKVGEFSFQLIDSTGEVIQTVTNGELSALDKEGIAFDRIWYDTVGTYTYTIKEVNGGQTIDGVTYDADIFYITVKVTDSRNGFLRAETTVNDTVNGGIVFENYYSPAPTNIVIEADKILTGRTLQAEEFSFELKDSKGDVLQTKKNDTDGNVVFDAIEYDTTGEYKYTVSEVKGSLGGVTYSEEVLDVTVKVTDSGDGKLEATVEKDGKWVEVDNFDIGNITNTYEPAPATIKFTADKTLLDVATNTNIPLGDRSYMFCLANAENHDVIEEVYNDTDGNVEFNELSLTEPGTYKYLVHEVNPGTDTDGVWYDGTNRYYTVKVVDNGQGQLVAYLVEEGKENQQITEDINIDFVNRYNAKEVHVDFSVVKNLVDKDGNDIDFGGRNFKFVLNLTEAPKNSGKTPGKVEEITINSSNVQEALFETLIFTDGQEGKYTYTISEINGGETIDGVTNSDVIYTAHVDVHDNGKGELEANITIDKTEGAYNPDMSTIVFTNVYNAKPTKVVIEADKKLVDFKGDALNLDNGEFKFQLLKNGVLIDEASNDASGNVVFEAIEFKDGDEGTHVYTVKEVKGNLGGVTYDTASKEVVITVTDDGKGNLVSKVGENVVNTTDTINAGTFNNKYDAESTSVEFDATKVLNGRELKEGEFTFELKDSDGDVLQTKTNGANGKVNFDAIEYKDGDEGTYTYTVSEVKGKLGGVTYDETVYTAVVTVEDSGEGYLTASTAITANGKAADSMTFTNSYEAYPTEISLKATKVLNGRDLKAGEFEFKLKDKDGKVLQTKKNDADGNIVFDAIEYDATGEYKYTVSEVVPADEDKLGGVSYNDEVLKVTVKVTDSGDGKLEATVDGEEVAEKIVGTITNDYEAEPTKLVITAKKILTGRNDALKAGEFSFQLSDEFGNELQEKANDAKGDIVFDAIEFTQTGIYKYKVHEVGGGTNENGIDYSADVHNFTVVVTDSGDGKLEATIDDKEVETYYAGEFVNTYYADSTHITLKARKVLEGRELKDGEFSFELKDKDGKVLQTKFNNDYGTVTFDTIEYTHKDAGPSKDEAKVYTYTVSEVKGNLAGVTYATTVHNVKVEVYDNNNGEVVADVTVNDNPYVADAGAILFENEYSAEPISVDIDATKTLSGRELSDSEFSFQLKDSEGNVIETVRNKGGVVDFAPIEFTDGQEGTYTYTISEVEGNLGGVTYDEAVKTVTVEIADNGEGKLTAKVDKTAVVEELDVNAGEFVNNYDADPVSVTIEADKSLEGRAMKAGEFIFKLFEGEKELQTVTNAADGSVTFDAIKYDAVGTHTYTVKEVKGDLGGVTYDETAKTVTVEVTDNGKGKLVASVGETDVSNGTANAGEFKNEYNAEPVSVDFESNKVLDGRDLKAGEFTFELYEGKNLLQSKQNDADGNVSFEAITYTKNDAGFHTYTVKEVKGTLGGITYDETVKEVIVNVYDDGNGNMVAEVGNVAVDKHDFGTFVNTYETEDTSLKLTGKKVLNGRDLEEGEFTFELYEGETLLDTKKNDAKGNVSFDEITYTKDNAGEHTYTVKEVKGELGGVDYDKTVKTVTVNVYDDGNGNMVAAIDKVAVTEYDFGDFTNTYTTKGTSVVIEGIKVLEGRTLKADEFKFQLKDAEGQVVQTVKNAADGTFVFDEITYDAAGTYNYTVSEVKGTLGGVTYDETIYNVEVKVTDNLKGQLVREVKVNDVVDGAIKFNNIYETEDVTVGFKAFKTLYGRELKAGEFTFQLTGSLINGTVLGTNNAEGNVEFTKDGKAFNLTFTEAGTYDFTFKEAKGSLGGVTYDVSEHEVKVTVVDDGNGNLLAKVDGNEIEVVDGGIFENVYKTKDNTLLFKAFKTLEGRELNAGEFTFELTGDLIDGIVTGTNDAAGNVKFYKGYAEFAITFTEEGTYNFTVKEVKDTLGGVTYDESLHNVTVNVEDDGNGNLVAKTDGSEILVVDGGEFKNIYEPDDASAVIEGTKVLEGRDLEADEFEFQLKDAEGKVVQTVKNAADGTFAFDELTYDAVGTFGYTVNEVKGTLEGVTYDETVYEVEVTVTDNKEGQLEAEVKINGKANGEIQFSNTYEAPIPELSIEKMQSVGDGERTKDLLEVAADDIVTYYVRVWSHGECAAEDLVITDEVPEGLILIEESLEAEGGVLGADGKTITWNIDKLEVGDDVTVTFKVVVPSVTEDELGPDGYKHWINIATVAYGNNPENPEDPDEPDKEIPSNEVEIREPLDPHLNIEKLQSVNDGKATKELLKVEAGDVVTYIIRVWSDGETAAEDLVITDEVPEGLKLIEESLEAEGGVLGEDGKTITWNIDKLEVGEDAIVTFKVKVPSITADDVEADGYKYWDNIAAVSYGNNPENPEDPDKEIPSNKVEIKEPVPPFIPKTGDDTNMMMWLAMLMASAMGAAGTFTLGRRKEEQ